MPVPNVPSQYTGREYLRIGGGYKAPAKGASPAGGADIDNAGNIATDGELTVDGDLHAMATLNIGHILRLGTPVNANIQDGVIPFLATRMAVNGENGQSDELHTITGGNDGDILLLQQRYSSADITLKDATGNINMRKLGEVSLGVQGDSVILLYDESRQEWIALLATA